VQLLQLTSSAVKNYASKFLKFVSRFSGSTVGTIIDDDGHTAYGTFDNGVFVMMEPDESGIGHTLVQRTKNEVRPVAFFPPTHLRRLQQRLPRGPQPWLGPYPGHDSGTLVRDAERRGFAADLELLEFSVLAVVNEMHGGNVAMLSC
jgi:hypothetical protein